MIVKLILLGSGIGSRQFCRGRGRGRGREVEAEARQGSNVLNDVTASVYQCEAEAESSRPRRGRAKSMLCHFDIMHNAHVVVTCYCFVVNDIYQ